MQVSRGGYYAWLSRKPNEREKENETLLCQIRRFFERSKGTYGSPRILRDLREEGFRCGKHRVARLMRQSRVYALSCRAGLGQRPIPSTRCRGGEPAGPRLHGFQSR
jgi:hypothetical protein